MIQIEESNPSFESCHECIHDDDYEEICIARRCIHAVAQLKECYVPKQPPEIVRCKDCRYMTEHYDTDGNVPYWTCSEWDSGTDYDGFCHYAERRTDERPDQT